MSYRSLLPDTRYTLASPPMENVFVALCDEREFAAELRATGSGGLIIGPVLWMRLYQRRAAQTPEYSVYFVAVIQLRYSRVELRRHCGDQDLNQASGEHPASRQAARLQQQLIAECLQLGVDCREAGFEEIR